jgi:hypothetical protein
VVDGRRQRADVTFDFSFLAAIARVSGNALKGRGIFYGKVDFVTGPAIATRLDSGRRWVEVTDDQLRETGGLSGGISGASSLDPTKPVDHLRAVTGDAEKLGSETVGGAQTEHYRTKVDYRRYLAFVPPRDRPAMTKAVDELEATFGTSTFPVEAWIDSAGTIRRAKGFVERPGVRLEYTVDLHAVGEPVKIKPPPAAKVADARNL